MEVGEDGDIYVLLAIRLRAYLLMLRCQTEADSSRTVSWPDVTRFHIQTAVPRTALND
jgi:hypothetical protein